MEMTPVSSTNLAAVGYDLDSAVLRVQFLKGGTYDISGVPQEVFEAFMAAPSKGQYYNQNIKKAGYPYTKIG